MKLRLPFMSRKAHAAALSKAREQAAQDHAYLIDQLAQAARKNAALERANEELALDLTALKN